jgi:ATP-dependent Clp protease ATP-binding subunit ClpB
MPEALPNPTRKRLEELEKELRELREKRDGLKAHWHLEKSNIQTIRKLTSDIEDAKVQAAEYERQGNFAKVAEIRYGTILDYKKQLDAAHRALGEVQTSGKMLKEEVDAEDIAEIVAKWTGIPVQRMVESERTKLLHMEDRLHQRVVAQADAVHAISNALRRSRAGLQDANRPIGSFIFLGTTGVGKTEMARAVAEFLFDDENAIVRIDMSEYMEKFSVSRLIGAPPGYVGYEEGGQLTEAVRRKQYSVVLLDEIEKAHPEVFNVLLQVLDDGRLTDGKGREVNFRNTIIIMTSNLGTEFIQDKLLEITDENRDEIIGSVRSQIVALLRQKMRPEFLNRIDEIILFKPLTQSEIRQIARVQLDKLAAKLRIEGIAIDVSDDALDWIARIGYDVQFGARPLRRAIQKYVADPLAMKLLGGEFGSGDSIRMDVSNAGSLSFVKQ